MTALRGFHHIGVPVRSLEKSLAWYRAMFGIEPEFFAESEGPATSAAVQLEGARVRVAFLTVGGTYLELLEYDNPIGADFRVDGGFRLRNCDVGAIHLAIEVDSIDAAYQKLRAGGAEFSVEPSLIEEGPLTGHKFCYFRDPDGIQFELFELPR